ncbi:MAG: EAL domain-containing protein [Deltaproteobacteria bacterium]|jgi:EAL domain-containing protein (putative c-di-GMP-specific phosphodiesterase class I)
MPLSAVPRSAPSQRDVLEAIEASPSACEYQPIVRADEETIWGYEALARFSVGGTTYAPDDVFHALHEQRARFLALETRAKRFQLENRPAKHPLFVNLDPDVCEGAALDHWVTELGGADDLVVEIIENTSVTNLDNVRRFTQRLDGSGVNVALDDIGGTNNLFSFDLLEDVRYLKLDRRWFERLDRDPAYRSLLGGMIEFARARGVGTVLEGVESRRHLSIARGLGVDFVQGFLFADAFLYARA